MLNKNDFDSLRNQSHFLYSPSLLAFYKKDSESQATKLGLSISKKYGNAVKRNRLKRIIRENFRCSSFKESGITVNIVPNLKNFKKKKYTHSDFEKLIKEDFQVLFNSMNK